MRCHTSTFLTDTQWTPCFVGPHINAQEIVHTHVQLAALRDQLENVHAALPAAHGTLGGIATAGAVLARRYPLAHVTKHMVTGAGGATGNSLSPDRRSTDDGPPSLSSSSSYLGPAQLSPEQTALVDETVALRLARLTAAFATVDDALRYPPETLARLATALTALEVCFVLYLCRATAAAHPSLTLPYPSRAHRRCRRPWSKTTQPCVRNCSGWRPR